MRTKDEEIVLKAVSIKAKIAALEAEYTEMKASLFKACDKLVKGLESPRIDTDDAVLVRSSTRGTWKFSAAITKLDNEVKAMKKVYQLKHEPISGREPMWIIKLSKKEGSASI